MSSGNPAHAFHWQAKRFSSCSCRTHTVDGVCTARHAVQRSNFNTLSPHTDMFTPPPTSPTPPSGLAPAIGNNANPYHRACWPCDV
eukprot:9491868-Pyramimonas_sp.AAC.1